MAASPVHTSELAIGDLREYRPNVLEALLTEQAAFWNEELRWDFSASKDILLRFISLRNLHGFVLLKNSVPIGYSYFIHENHKALLGDLFVLADHRGLDAEQILLKHTLRAAAVFPGVRRIEGQLLALSGELPDTSVYGRKVQTFPRNFMIAEQLEPAGSYSSSAAIGYRTWTDRDLEPTAELICRAYQGHVDASINDQYRSVVGARRFLFNSTQHPGCGLFFRNGARAAVHRLTGAIAGVCLGSLVQTKVGHITQLCVDPGFRRLGLGAHILSQSLDAYRTQGCEAVSLTVTASNHGAIQLYERAGFRTHRRFSAFVWESF
jgi:ribosomal protein S18 acetylase RimI-like enzyme